MKGFWWGGVQGQRVREAGWGCLEANIRTVAFILFAKANHWRLLIRCEMWSRPTNYNSSPNSVPCIPLSDYQLLSFWFTSSRNPTWMILWTYQDLWSFDFSSFLPFFFLLFSDVLSLLLSPVKSYGHCDHSVDYPWKSLAPLFSPCSCLAKPYPG